jgi:hypothetical protein
VSAGSNSRPVILKATWPVADSVPRQVSVEGRASQAVIEARDGSVQIGYAETASLPRGDDKARAGLHHCR